MKKLLIFFLVGAVFMTMFVPDSAFCSEEHFFVLMETSMGDIKIDLNYAKAPITVKNFLKYVDSGFYDGTVFHRVIPGFMIQGGGFTKSMQKKSTNPPIKNEAGNGLKNDIGTIAMARTGMVDSATAQFFINVNDNKFLNHRSENPSGFGYAVFGKVVEGLDVMNKISHTRTTAKGAHRNLPVEEVLIKSIKVIK